MFCFLPPVECASAVCTSRDCFDEKYFPHKSHGNCNGLPHFYKWAFSLPGVAKHAVLHTPHANGLTSVWDSTWHVNSPFTKKPQPHVSQTYL